MTGSAMCPECTEMPRVSLRVLLFRTHKRKVSRLKTDACVLYDFAAECAMPRKGNHALYTNILVPYNIFVLSVGRICLIKTSAFDYQTQVLPYKTHVSCSRAKGGAQVRLLECLPQSAN